MSKPVGHNNSPEAHRRSTVPTPVNGVNPNRQRSKSTSLFDMETTSQWMEEIRNTRKYSSTPLMYPHDDPDNKIKVAFSKILTAVIYYCLALPFMVIKIIMSVYTERRYRKRQVKRFENSLKYTEDVTTWYKAAVELDRLRGYDEWRLEEDTVSTTEQRQGGASSPPPPLPASPTTGQGKDFKKAAKPSTWLKFIARVCKGATKQKVRIDARALVEETRAIRELTASGNQSAIGEYIRTHLLRDALGLANKELYIYHTGTKYYVEDYLEACREMIQQFSMDASLVSSSSAAASGSGTAVGGNTRPATPVVAAAVAEAAAAAAPGTPGSIPTNSWMMDLRQGLGTPTTASSQTWQLVGGGHANSPSALKEQATKRSTPAGQTAVSTDEHTSDGIVITDHESTYTQAMLDFAQKNKSVGSTGYSLSVQKKLDILEAAKQSMGNTALMLSGGASLGMYHVGVVRALYENNLLPNIVSGSSAGAIVGGVICCKEPHELEEVILDGMKDVCFKAFEEIQQAELNFMVKMKRLLGSGGFMDVNQLVMCMRKNCGDLTFLEAYRKTGRAFNVSVAADREGDKATLLNYVTSPHVLIWSGVVASCCMPGLYKKFQLSQKDPATQKIVPYMEGQLWFDGSVANDLPRRQLTEMFHCSFFIVSQVNPHVIPFVKNYTPNVHKKPSGWFKTLWFSACAEAGHWIYKVSDLIHQNPALSGQVSEFLYSLMRQEYTGDVSIFPIGSVWEALPDFVNITTNPTPEHMAFVGGKGLRRSLPYVNRIRCMTEVERVLDQEIERLRNQVKINNRTERLRKEKV